jgi:hypothetical protein
MNRIRVDGLSKGVLRILALYSARGVTTMQLNSVGRYQSGILVRFTTQRA